MRISKIILTIVVFLFVLYSCRSQDCNQLPSSFKSYKEAVNKVKSSNFIIEEDLNTSKSSWIRGASYYSCDKVKGYLIIETDSREYIHQNVPIEVWKRFKKATSFGRFYNTNIKGNYRLEIKKSYYDKGK